MDEIEERALAALGKFKARDRSSIVGGSVILREKLLQGGCRDNTLFKKDKNGLVVESKFIKGS